jgi:hypothetical protein
MNCGVHIDVAATAVCCECGNGVCPSCRNKMFGRNYCDVCAAGLERKMTAPKPAAPPPQFLVQVAPARPPVPLRLHKSPTIAAVLSACIPGAGQLYTGRVGRGIGVFIGTMVLTPIFLGWFLWVAQVFDAHTLAKDHNLGLDP